MQAELEIRPKKMEVRDCQRRIEAPVIRVGITHHSINIFDPLHLTNRLVRRYPHSGRASLNLVYEGLKLIAIPIRKINENAALKLVMKRKYAR